MYFLKKYRRGIKNKYRKGMPFPEMVIKDLAHSLQAFRFFIKNGFKNKTVLVYPHFPSRGSTIYKALTNLNYNITNKPSRKHQMAVYWEYLTFREEYAVMEEESKSKKVVNLFSRDISKIYVDNAFKKVFNYNTIIDPQTHTGKAVQKNDINAMHDGAVINCPISGIKEGYIYQILIDNSTPDNHVKDIRVPIINGLLDFVYIKYRDINERFKNTTVKTEVVKTADVFSLDEIDKINAFCKEISLEYGELDVLRDNNNNQIYVVDVNNTPQGPPANTPKPKAKEAIARIASEFEKAFL